MPLFAVGIGGLVRDLVKPYKSDGDRIARRLAGVIAAHAGPDDQVIVLDEDWRLPPGVEWYLRQGGVRVLWNGQVDEQRLERTTRQLWVISFLDARQRRPRVEDRLTRNSRPFVLNAEAEYRFSFGWDPGQSDRCRLFHWVEATSDTEPSGVITAEGDARSIGSKLVPAALDKRP